LYAVKRVLKVIEHVWRVDSGAPLLFVHGATLVKSINFLLSKGPPIGSPLLFVRGATRVKSINFFAE
jgi:hypothetical protein